MINHSKGIDCWDLYARMCAGEKLDVKLPRDLVCCYAARIYGRPYALSHEELLARYGGEIVLHMPMDSKVMGDYAYLVLTETQERRKEILEKISELK